MGLGKKVSRLKADMAADLKLREINEHLMTVEIRKLRERNAVLARWTIGAWIVGIAIGVVICEGVRYIYG